MHRFWVMLAVLLPLFGPAQSVAAGAVSFGRGDVTVVSAREVRHRFEVEIATTPEQFAQGLMFRRSMPERHGMLFDFGLPRPVSMWMKNTFIPLDMLFIAADGRIIHIAERTVPESEEVITAPADVRFVLELNAGTTRRLGITPGDRLSISQPPR